jgi:hypothetical protein
MSLSYEDIYLANLLAPRVNIIKYVGDSTSVDLDLLPTIEVGFFHAGTLFPITTKGVHHVFKGLRRMGE